jgi:hypothetical protein
VIAGQRGVCRKRCGELKSATASIFFSLDFCGPISHGQGRIRTSEGLRQQIYSLPPLSTWVPARKDRLTLKGYDAGMVIRNCVRIRLTIPKNNTGRQTLYLMSLFFKSRRPDSNWRPAVYKTATLPLSYTGTSNIAQESVPALLFDYAHNNIEKTGEVKNTRDSRKVEVGMLELISMRDLASQPQPLFYYFSSTVL